MFKGANIMPTQVIFDSMKFVGNNSMFDIHPLSSDVSDKMVGIHWVGKVVKVGFLVQLVPFVTGNVPEQQGLDYGNLF